MARRPFRSSRGGSKIAFNPENRTDKLQLLALSRKIAARRPPVFHYALLAALALIAFSYEVRLTYQNLPEWFGRTDAPRRPFFAEDVGTGPITIDFLNREAKEAGLKAGDELVAVNGKPVVGTFVFGEAMHQARAGDALRVRDSGR
jgi:hypothetical protein